MIGTEFLQAGSFNVRLSVEEPVSTPDGCGGRQIDWQFLFAAWVRLVPVRNILLHKARDETMEITHWIILRKRPELTRHMRFVTPVGGGRTFEIDTLHDPDETGRYVLCQVREID